MPRALIAETIDVIAVLSGRGTARRLSELAEVDGLDPVTGVYHIQSVSLSFSEISRSANGESS